MRFFSQVDFSPILQVPDRVIRWFGQGGENLGEERDADGINTAIVGTVTRKAEGITGGMGRKAIAGSAGGSSGGASGTQGAPASDAAKSGSGNPARQVTGQGGGKTDKQVG